jgi:hypothetical protein
VTGPGYGLVMSSAEGVLLDRVWIHDTKNRGIQAYDSEGPASLHMADSLVEGAERTGIILSGASATLERTVVRGTLSETDPEGGWGITVANGDEGPASLSLSAGVVEDNQGIGVSLFGSNATIDATVLRSTRPVRAGLLGRGIAVSEGEGGQRSTLTVRGSVVDRNHEAGIAIEGSDVTVETTTIRDTAPIMGSEPPLDVRGVVVQPGGFTSAPGTLVLRQSLVDNNLGAGIFIGTSTAELESVLIRDSQPQPPAEEAGMGVYLRDGAAASIRLSAIENSRVAGIAIVASEATVEHTAVRNTQAAASGLFGDGIAVLSHQTSIAKATLVGMLVQSNQRAGIGNFAANVFVDGSTLECNAVDLAGEPHGSETDAGFDFDEGAANACGCDVEDACIVQTTGLAPPTL